MLLSIQYFMHLVTFKIQHTQIPIALPFIQIPLSFQLPSKWRRWLLTQLHF